MTHKSSFQELINGDTPVLIDFFATWCGPCKVMEPELKKFASGKYEGKVNVIKVDVDKNQQAAASFGVQGVPTLVLMQRGEIKWRQSGVLQAHQLEQVLAPYIK